METPQLETPYDRVLYDGSAFLQAHPDRMATMASLLGAACPEPAGCRVLELGCGVGSHLIPIALAMPDSEFVGVDLSHRQIAQAKKAAQATGAGNVRLEAMNLLDFPADFGAFDFIITHGVYSWTPEDVRDKIMAICREHLSPQGVAYISYNVNPGWRLRSVAREALLYHTESFESDAERISQAKAMLDFLCQATPEGLSDYAGIFNMEKEILSRVSVGDAYLFHELLEENNEPVYFHQFAAHAQRHGLAYLGEADPSDYQTDALPGVAGEMLTQLADDYIRREQYRDFVVKRLFRQSLLIHSEAPADRQFNERRMTDLLIASPFSASHEEGGEVAFYGCGGVEARTAHALCQSAFAHLGRIWPRSISFNELLTQARANLTTSHGLRILSETEREEERQTLATSIWKLFQFGALEIHRRADAFTTEPGAMPQASQWARWQAKLGRNVTNQRHQSVELSDIQRAIIALLDGGRSAEQLLEAFADIVSREKLIVERHGRRLNSLEEQPEALREVLDFHLKELAKVRLLTG